MLLLPEPVVSTQAGIPDLCDFHRQEVGMSGKVLVRRGFGRDRVGHRP